MAKSVLWTAEVSETAGRVRTIDCKEKQKSQAKETGEMSRMNLKRKHLVRIWRENLEKQVGDNEGILEIYFL